MNKYKGLSCVVGVIMIISIIKPLLAPSLLGCFGAWLWIKGSEVLGK